jgi:hypothetical protein
MCSFTHVYVARRLESRQAFSAVTDAPTAIYFFFFGSGGWMIGSGVYSVS